MSSIKVLSLHGEHSHGTRQRRLIYLCLKQRVVQNEKQHSQPQLNSYYEVVLHSGNGQRRRGLTQSCFQVADIEPQSKIVRYNTTTII